jgi:hypothetical protein
MALADIAKETQRAESPATCGAQNGPAAVHQIEMLARAMRRSGSKLREGDELLHVDQEWNSAVKDAPVAFIIANL